MVENEEANRFARSQKSERRISGARLHGAASGTPATAVSRAIFALVSLMD
jgi:hypothetical protein